MAEPCSAAELRTLFLFEDLSDAQLAVLCAAGRVETFPAGQLYREGEPAERFYVMFEGELVMTGRAGGVDVLTNRTSQRGVYCGAWSAYVPGAEPQYTVSVRLIRPSRFFVLDAPSFAEFMQSEFPMAVHLLGGHTLGGLRQRQLLGQQEKLLALGNITAGLTHQLNNPAAAITRAIADLRTSIAKMRQQFSTMSDGRYSPHALLTLLTIQDELAEQLPKSKSQERTPLGSADREDEVCDWLGEHGIADGWHYAPTLVEAGLDVGWLENVAESVGTLDGAIGWLVHTIDTELRMNEIAAAGKRISALLAGAEQYSQMDRGAYQSVDIHEMLQSTVTMFGDRIGAAKPVTLTTDWDPSVPEILCYPGDLNQVWTNIINNALEAMGGQGTLRLRTALEDGDVVRIEICDDGPGISEENIDHVFTPFFTTKPAGKSSGLGLDIAWRVIVDKHHGDLSVESRPGDTRFIARLPVRAPAPHTP